MRARLAEYFRALRSSDPRSYASIDSAPPNFAVARSPWAGPSFLALFGLIAAALLLARPAVLELLGAAQSGTRQTEDAFAYGIHAFFVALFMALAALADGSLAARLHLLAVLGGAFLGSSLLIHLAAGVAASTIDDGLLFATTTLATGHLGLGALSLGLLTQFRRPTGIDVVTVVRRSPAYGVILAATVLLAGLVSVLVVHHASGLLGVMHDVALLGGILPGLVAFRLLLFAQWRAIAWVDLRRSHARQRPRVESRASVGFIVPAFNEQATIAECLQSIDEAAQVYGHLVTVYVVDNGSHDKTVRVAHAALRSLEHINGKVFVSAKAGKSQALNDGLRKIRTEIVIRVDADTLIGPEAIRRAVGHFADPAVGIVGGMPRPLDRRSPFLQVRLIEVMDRIGFVRVAQNAIDAVMCVPGTFAAYRHAALTYVGEFASGINGEDTDMTVRIGRAGYRVVTDPGIDVFTEVPLTWAHLREQRLRWGRGMLHVLGRHLPAFGALQGPRGVWVMPWVLVNVARQAMVVPVLVFTLVVALVDPVALPLGEGSAVVAIILGVQLLATALVLLFNRRLDMLQYLPDYIAFRTVRSYFALESLFTLVLEPVRRDVPASAATQESSRGPA